MKWDALFAFFALADCHLAALVVQGVPKKFHVLFNLAPNLTEFLAHRRLKVD